METVGALIRKAREPNRGRPKRITQEQLRALVGVTKNTICAWERGGVSPRFEDLMRICDACGVPRSWFNYRHGSPASQVCADVQADGARQPDPPEAA